MHVFAPASKETAAIQPTKIIQDRLNQETAAVGGGPRLISGLGRRNGVSFLQYCGRDRLDSAKAGFGAAQNRHCRRSWLKQQELQVSGPSLSNSDLEYMPSF